MRSVCFETVFTPTSPPLVNTETKHYTSFAMSIDCIQTDKTVGIALIEALHLKLHNICCLLKCYFAMYSRATWPICQ
jgi:hypothetical protein